VGTAMFHADGRTDRHDEDMSLFSILRTRLQTNILTRNYTWKPAEARLSRWKDNIKKKIF